MNELRYLIAHLDRCPHGRHERDHCSYCQRDGHDLNQGNPYAPLPDWRLGTDLSGNPITWADLLAALDRETS